MLHACVLLLLHLLYTPTFFGKVKERQGLTLSPRLVCSGMILAHSKLHLPGSSDPPISSSGVAKTTACHHTQLLFVFLIEMGFHNVA